jgi:predicted nucleotide-binding protein (sugar kinase/HSP70/actin superfamily)
MAPAGALDAGTVKLVKRPYWTYEDEVVGAAGHYLDQDADGVLGVVCFGCGPDSMMLEVVQRAAKGAHKTPFSTIVIDEHTGEAGLVTRLEAFVDMLERRKKLRATRA